MERKGFCGFGKRVKFFESLVAQLVVAATGKFELSEEMEDGLSLEVHLTNYWRQSGVLPDQLNIPPIPVELEYVWEWWLKLHSTRSVGMEECHITYTEIMNWSSLLKINIDPFEVRCIMALDSAYLACRIKQRERKMPSGGK